MATRKTPNATAIPNTLLSEEDIALSLESGRALAPVLQTRAGNQTIDVHDGRGAVRTVCIPTSARHVLMGVVTEAGQGNAVSIIPIHAELTTEETADVPSVSRPFLVEFLEKGDIPFHKIGTHHRVRYQDVVDYKKTPRYRTP